MTNVFTELTQIGGWMKGFDGELPYSFTPNKSVLLVFDGIHYPIFSANFPDAMFRSSYFTICYWKNNQNQKIKFKTPSGESAGMNTKLFMKEW